MYKDLQQYLERKHYISVLRAVGEHEESISGVPVGLSRSFLVMQEVSEFYLYGYCIIPIKSILEVGYDATHQFIERIMVSEGIMDQVKAKHALDLTNWKTVFEGLMATGLSVTLQCEDDDEDYEFIGPVKRVDADAAWVHCFDSEGVLEESWYDISFDEISRVAFDDPYANMFSKHLRSLN